MKNTVKLFAIIALTAIITLVACGGNGSNPPPDTRAIIEVASISVTHPVTGVTGSTIAAFNGWHIDEYTLGPVVWEPALEGGKFEADTVYKASVTITAADTDETRFTAAGFEWVKINGEEAGVVIGNGGNTATLSYTFPATTELLYIITADGTNFIATKSGETEPLNTAGTMTNTLQAIRDDFEDERPPVTIQFGNGTDPLTLSAAVVFSGSNWGQVTMSGKITSTIDGNNTTIQVQNTDPKGILTSVADVNVTGSGRAFQVNDGAELTIAGGTITSSNTQGAIVRFEHMSSTVNITGGTFNVTGGSQGIRFNGNSGSATTHLRLNIHGGTFHHTNGDTMIAPNTNDWVTSVNITGGKIQGDNNWALYRHGGNTDATRNLDISGTAWIIGTIAGGDWGWARGVLHIEGSATWNVNISGGKIENIGTGDAENSSGNTIRHQNTNINSEINISGKTIIVREGGEGFTISQRDNVGSKMTIGPDVEIIGPQDLDAAF
ncbi:MAG: hypothetical protein FWG89_02770 [Treponema sp.]|nr:hypothetical protein [Treponema sp.]